MADPFRLRVLIALCNCLKKIEPKNGYTFDLSDFSADVDGVSMLKERVLRGRDWYGDDDPVPMISILEIPKELEQEDVQNNNPVVRGPWDLNIQGFVKADDVHPTDSAHRMMGDVKLALSREKLRILPGSRGTPDYFGMGSGVNMIEGFSIGTGTVRPPDEISPLAYFYLVLSLKIAEDPSNPYV